MLFLGVVFGGIIGISLGLTGGGGAIFAVPMLAYGIGRPACEAVVVSLHSVGVPARHGVAKTWGRRARQVRYGDTYR